MTEPAVIRQRLSNLPKTYQVIPQIREGSPRAAIYSSGHIKIHEISSLTQRDVVVGLLKCGGKQTALISAYMDIKIDAIPSHFLKVLEYCKAKGYSILIAADTNSHNTLWGKLIGTQKQQYPVQQITLRNIFTVVNM